MPPLISHRVIRLSPPSGDDRRAHDLRIKDALGMNDLDIPLSVLRSATDVLRKKWTLSCAIGRGNGRPRLVDLDAERSFCIALDLGSTNLVAQLYDNIGQRTLITLSRENPQVAFGSDILTRMHHAMSGNGQDVYRVLTNGINDLLADLCREARINTRDIHGMAAAGNTAMTHFLLGLDIGTIPIAPWVPVVRVPGYRSAAELGLSMSPEAPVYIFPNAGSYVGGDITAGIIATGLHRSERISILVDVGTNAEVVIGNRDWIIVGAGAAGPALEEGISRIGRRATSGIVYDVTIRDDTVSCKTFDEKAPTGICGTGMISLVYELYRAGIIDQTGTFRDDPRVTSSSEDPSFVLACGGSGLTIAQTEIRNFLRSKAAMFTLLLTLTRSVGITFGDVERVSVAGALGNGIDVAKAAGIGMVPAWPAAAIRAMGNTSLAGCRLLLVDADRSREAEALVDRITYKHMHDDPEFMREFPGAVFIPHTNPDLLKV
jgi:uncharacterized 2Fe-2S/4Fe-4S cluster protein (DUF4445 family)